MKRVHALAVLCFLVALALACGSNEQSAKQQSSRPVTSAQTPSNRDAAPATDPAGELHAASVLTPSEFVAAKRPLGSSVKLKGAVKPDSMVCQGASCAQVEFVLSDEIGQVTILYQGPSNALLQDNRNILLSGVVRSDTPLTVQTSTLEVLLDSDTSHE